MMGNNRRVGGGEAGGLGMKSGTGEKLTLKAGRVPCSFLEPGGQL